MKLKKLFSVIATVLAMSFCLTACDATGVQGEKGDKGEQGIQGVQGEKGEKGDKGDKGQDGTQVTIGENGNWFLDGVDTGVKAEGNNTGGGSSGGEVEDDGYTPIVRFAVTSDLHLREDANNDYGSRRQLTKLIDSVYKYS